MPKRSERVETCLQKAAAARECAQRSCDPAARNFYLEMEQRWSRLADSNAYVDQMERMLRAGPRTN